MARKRIKVSRPMLITWLVLASFILLLAPQKLTSKFQFAFARVFRWPLSTGRNIALSARIQEPPATAVQRREYVQIQNYLATVRKQLEQQRSRNAKLSAFRKRIPFEDARFALAYIIKASPAEFIIDCGRDDGLTVGQFVLGDNSIIGTISQVSAQTARVELVVSPRAQIAVTIANQDAILQGSGNNSAKIVLLPTKHKVKVGDDVFAAPKPGLLNCLIIMGRIAQCRTNDEYPLTWDITVQPACDIEKLSSVDVIVMNPHK